MNNDNILNLINRKLIKINNLPALNCRTLHKYFNKPDNFDNILNLLKEPNDFKINSDMTSDLDEEKMLEKLKATDLAAKVDFLSSIFTQDRKKEFIEFVKKYYKDIYGSSFIIPDDLTFEQKICFAGKLSDEEKDLFNKLKNHELMKLLDQKELPYDKKYGITSLCFNALEQLKLSSKSKYIFALLNEQKQKSFISFLSLNLELKFKNRLFNIDLLAMHKFLTIKDLMFLLAHKILCTTDEDNTRKKKDR